MRVAFVLVVLLALSATAAGHGGSTQQQKFFGPYRATFFAYDYVTEGEAIQASWEIVQNGTGAPVEAGGAVVVVTEVGADGKEGTSTERHPSQTQRGFIVLELEARRQGVLRYDLRLDGHNGTFEQRVCSVDVDGQLRCGLEPPLPARTPVPAALALLALALAARRR